MSVKLRLGTKPRDGNRSVDDNLATTNETAPRSTVDTQSTIVNVGFFRGSHEPPPPTGHHTRRLRRAIHFFQLGNEPSPHQPAAPTR